MIKGAAIFAVQLKYKDGLPVTPMTPKVRDTHKMMEDTCMAENIYSI